MPACAHGGGVSRPTASEFTLILRASTRFDTTSSCGTSDSLILDVQPVINAAPCTMSRTFCSRPARSARALARSMNSARE